MAKVPSNFHAYAYAQEMNKNAAIFVKICQYDRAISALAKTLQLWKEREVRDFKSDFESESFICSPDIPSGRNDVSDLDGDRANGVIITGGCESPGIDDDSEYQTGFDCGHLYQNLMRIPCKNNFGDHNASSAVPLIIILNLAITYHIKATVLNSKPTMQKTLQLYELANSCLNRYMTDTHNLRGANEIAVLVEMIILNNLSHLHLLMEDNIISRTCIEQLTSIIMCVVDEKVRNIDCRNFDIGCISLEVFFRNISPLVLTSQCADAA